MSSIIVRALSGLSAFGDALWSWIASMNAWVAALFVLAFALDRLLASRVSAAWRVLLYVPLLVRLLVPGGWVITVPVESAPTPSAIATEVVTATTPATTIPFAVAREPQLALSWAALLPLVYAVGAAILALRWHRERRRLQAILRASSDAPAWLRGLGRDFDIVEHPTAGPLLIGTRWPRLVLPRGLRDRIGEGGVRAVVAHEASHVRRRDPLLAATLHVIVILFWPILAVWCGASRVRTLLEIACDERALRSADAAGRRSYGEALIELASTRTRSVVALGFGDSLRERIVSLAASGRRWPAIGQATVAMLACVLIAACGSSRVERQTVETQAAPGATSPDAVEEADRYQIEYTPFQPEAPARYRLEYAVLGKPILLDTAEIASVRTVELGELLIQNELAIIARPQIETALRRTSGIDVAAKADDGTTRTLRIESSVDSDDDGVLTIHVQCTEDGKPATILKGVGATFQLASDTTVEFRVGGTVARSIMLTVQPVNQPSGEVPILKDLPLLNVGTKGEASEVQYDPLGGEYPQVMCMMNLIEVDGPIFFSKDNVIEQGRDDGSAHRVQAGDLTEKTFDWFRRLKGYTNLSAPAILVKPGQDGSIRVGATDKAGSAVGGNEVVVRFVERDGKLRADVRWLVGGANGELVEGHHASDVAIDSNGAMLVILPSVPEKPGVGRILMVRPTVIRSQAEFPFQRGD